MKLPILMYHSIPEVIDCNVMRSLHVSLKSFSKQMWLLHKMGFKGCSVSEFLSKKDTVCGEKLIPITFDDAYLNFYMNAFPVLNKYNFTATVYAVSGLVGGKNQWDFDKGIKKLDLMNYDQLKDVMQAGIEIGCHTYSHVDLREVGVDLEKEIRVSKLKLETELDFCCESFCYPYGGFNSYVVDMVMASGFKNAVTMIRSRVSTSDGEFMLPRVPVNFNTPLYLFWAKIFTSYEDRRRNK